jgi:hypothetical protein
MSETTDTVLGIEKGFWTEADNPSYFEEHVADEGLSVIEPMGFIEKQQVIQSPAEKPWGAVEMFDVQVRQMTPDCVILAYHGRGRRDGDEKPYQGSIASTYLRIEGNWKLALSAHQPWTPRESEPR